MNIQPTIFISSIISEFFDLRGALKYFLGKSGFRVLMSEEPDFGADCDKDSLDNCKSRIEVSDYYFLIIGIKPGYEFALSDGTKTTVTYEEFKHFLKLKEKGENINLIAFVRNQAWVLHENNDFDKMPEIQHKFIDDLVNNSLLNKQIGRWRYTFNKFNDIITVLETNQNGLFLEANRKKGVYRSYIKYELTQVLKALLIKENFKGAKIKTLKQFLKIPDYKFKDFIEKEKIPRETAIHLKTFIQAFSYKEELLIKINRIFNYVSQGEFSYFDPTTETYELPEYVKAIIQSLEILEKVFINFKRGNIYKNLAKLDHDNFWTNEFEYGFVKGQLEDINIGTLKLINLMRCLHNNWNDFEKKDDEFYEYRGTANSISIDEVIEFSENYFENNGS